MTDLGLTLSSAFADYSIRIDPQTGSVSFQPARNDHIAMFRPLMLTNLHPTNRFLEGEFTTNAGPVDNYRITANRWATMRYNLRHSC